jgi:methionyl-tRNA formyltransferase
MAKDLLIFADGDVGVSVVSWLAKNHHLDIGLIFTVAENEISKICIDLGIETAVFSSDEKAIAEITERNISPKLGFLVWWPNIVTAKIISITDSGLINTHPSLLPYARGKNYNFWTLVERSPFGVSMHYVEEGIDCGDIVAQRKIEYNWEDTGGTLFKKAKTAMIELFSENFERLRDMDFVPIEQNISEGTFHFGKEMDVKSQIFLDDEYSARNLLNLLRARTMEGFPACYFYEDDRKYEVRIAVKKL